MALYTPYFAGKNAPGKTKARKLTVKNAPKKKTPAVNAKAVAAMPKFNYTRKDKASSLTGAPAKAKAASAPGVLRKAFTRNAATKKAATKKASTKKTASTKPKKSGCPDAGSRLVACRGKTKTRQMKGRCSTAGTDLIECRWRK